MGNREARPLTKLGQWIQAYCREHNMSRLEFSQRVGVAAATISRIERNGTPDWETFKRIAAYTGTPVLELMAMAGLEDVPDFTGVTASQRRLIDATRGLRNSDVDLLAALAIKMTQGAQNE